MAPIDMSGPGNPPGGRPAGSAPAAPNSPAALAARAQPGVTLPPAAPTYSVQAVTQPRDLDPTRARGGEDRGADRALLLHSQSLAAAMQEELRLQRKLTDLRESIEATEERLRAMQEEAQRIAPPPAPAA